MSHSAFISNKKCYVFGNNYFGQLGLGHTNNINTPTELPFQIDKLMNQPIIKMKLEWKIERLL